MTEKEAEKPGGSLLHVVFAVILFNVASQALEYWFPKPIAVGTAGLAVALLIYPFSPHPKVGFLNWILGSLLMIIGYVGIVYGASPPLCKQFGAVLTTGFITFFIFMSFPLLLSKFFGQKATEEPWNWLALGAGWGLLFAFFAYINPQGFCKP